MVFLTVGFPRETAEKRLDLKSLNEQTKAEELRTPEPEVMDRTPMVSAMPTALIGRLIASARVVYGDTMSTEHFSVRQSRVGPLWPSIEALLEPFLIKKPK